MVLTCDAYTQCRTQCCYAIVVCPTVTLRYCGDISWVLRKQLNINSLESSNYGAQDRQSCRRGTSPNFAWNLGGAAVFSRKHAKSLKPGEAGQWLLLITNRKLHMRFRLVVKSTTLDDLEWPLCTFSN